MEAAGIGARGTRAAGGGGSNRWKSLKRRLGCCGGSWAFRGASPDRWVREEDTAEDGGDGTGCDGEIREAATTVMNLAAALAAEREFRAASARPREEGSNRWEGEGVSGAPLRASSLMRLLAEGGGAVEQAEEEWWCCVCMGRRRGAAFIPCGHTLCRVCSREVWLNRGACPLCNHGERGKGKNRDSHGAWFDAARASEKKKLTALA